MVWNIKVNHFVWVLCVAVVFSGCTPQKSNESETVIDWSVPKVTVSGDFEEEQMAPDFTTQTMAGGSFDSQNFYGQKIIILDFYASWSELSAIDMPWLQLAQQTYADDVLVIGIHRTETESIENGMDFAQRREVDYLLIQDDGSLYQAAGGIGMPLTVFIDKDGIVRDIFKGVKTQEYLDEQIERIR